MESQNFGKPNCGVTKLKHLRAGRKHPFKITSNTYVFEFHFYIADINASAGRYIKTLMSNVLPSVFTFIKKKSSENQPKWRFPRKDHLIPEFVTPKQKKVRPEIINADTPPDNSFENNQQGSSIVCENCERLLLENILLKEEIKVLEEEKINLKKNYNVAMFMLVA